MRNQNAISESKAAEAVSKLKPASETSSIAILRVDGRIFRDCR
ncbi:hypothetical protein T08_15894 [Trichinella sp. T8]|nr:hypothetical protein T08_15894 [Trichinella sp. T8]